MKIIGLTGQSGTGKSTLAQLAEQKGFAVLDCDSYARKATQNPAVLQQLACGFGADILQNGVLNRKLLATRAFCSNEKTALLNQIMLPAVLQLVKAELKMLEANGVNFALLDAPTLYESGLNTSCRAVVAVLAPEKLRRERLLLRDGLTPRQLEDRMTAAKSDDFFTNRADYILINNGSKTEFANRAEALLEHLKNNL